ncbi:MAG: hypothetical protein WDZ41_01980 [Candidatus Babeliales bacterium]
MKKIFFLLFFYLAINYGKEEDVVKYIEKGNLSLPTSQQLGPLFSFGQNVIDKGDFQVYAYDYFTKGNNKKSNELFPYPLYGIRDDLSIFLSIPAAKFKENNQQTFGLEDMFIQAEYAYYNKDTSTYGNQATAIGALFFPTGISDKNPSTGYGSVSFFLGGTYSHLAIDWYYFFSPGVFLTTKRKGIKFGNQFFYQAGIGKNIAYRSKKWLLTWMVEFNGMYSQPDKINNSKDPNSGGNIVYIGPSLFFSTQRLILQVGIGVPITQHLFGNQNKNHFIVAGGIAWKFN